MSKPPNDPHGKEPRGGGAGKVPRGRGGGKGSGRATKGPDKQPRQKDKPDPRTK